MRNAIHVLKLAVLLAGALVVVSAPVWAAEKKAKEKLAVLDLEAKHGVEDSLVEALSVIVRDTLHGFGEHQVMSNADIQAVASREQLLQAMGSDEAGSQNLVNFGRTIGTRYMVAGAVSKLGSTYTISLRMIDTQGQDAGVTNRVSEICKCTEDALIITAQDVAAKLVGKPTSAAIAKQTEEAEQKRLKAESEQNQTAKLKTNRISAEAENERALDKAMKAYLQNSRQGMAELTSQAKEGNHFAAMMLERCHRLGVGGVKKDALAARTWKDGASKAMASLAKLAAQGNVIALSWLGNHARDSENPSEQENALQYFEKAAKQGYPYAMNALGWMYERGKGGLPQDEAKALEWYQEGAEKGDPASMTALGWIYAHRKSGSPRDDEAKAVEWYQKAVDKGNALSMARLGYMYSQGKGGLTKNDVKAVELYKKSAEIGEALGMNNLGSAYLKGDGGLPKDEVRAVEWFRNAAEKGHALSMANLGRMYEKGSGGLSQNQVIALEWYRKAADKGDAYGMSRLGYMYEMGHGNLHKDKNKALGWYKKAGEAGNEWAMNRLKQLANRPSN